MSKHLLPLRAHEHTRRAGAAVRANDDEVRRPSSSLIHNLVPRRPGPNVYGDVTPCRLMEVSGDTVQRGAAVLEKYERRFRAELRGRGQVQDVKLSADSIGHGGGSGLDDTSTVGAIVSACHDNVRLGRLARSDGAHSRPSDSFRRSGASIRAT